MKLDKFRGNKNIAETQRVETVPLQHDKELLHFCTVPILSGHTLTTSYSHSGTALWPTLVPVNTAA